MINAHKSGSRLRPIQHLHAVGADYPGAWKLIDTFRSGRGQDLPDWPAWCFLPMAAWCAILSAPTNSQRLSLGQAADIGRLAALGAWRYTQSIYRFDEELYSALTKTVLKGDLPCEALYNLPEWCVYIETPGQQWLGNTLHGFWAHLEWDANTGRHELRLLLDGEELVPVALHLGRWSLIEAVERFFTESERQSGIVGSDSPTDADMNQKLVENLQPLVSLLLYVCSNGVEYSGNSKPGFPAPKRIKKGWKLFPAQKPRVWKLGEKTGNTIRASRVHPPGDRKGPAPHIRRAHWHSFWTGPKDGDRKLTVKFIPPVPVATDDA